MKLKRGFVFALILCLITVSVLNGFKKTVVKADEGKLTFTVKVVDPSDWNQYSVYQRGDEVKVALRMDNNTKPGVTAFRIKLDIDPALVYQDITVSDTFSKDVDVDTTGEYEGKKVIDLFWVVTAEKLEDIPDIPSAEIAIITLKIADDATVGAHPIGVRIDSDDVYRSYLGVDDAIDENVEFTTDSSSAKVEVDVIPESFTLDNSTITLKEGETFTINPIVTPNDVSAWTYAWKSEDESVATVNENNIGSFANEGVISAKKTGKTNIIVEEKYTGKTATCEVTVVCNHNLEEHSATNPTCTSDGNSLYYICNNCGKYYADSQATTEITDTNSVVIPATGHTWDEGVVTTAPTCTEKGIKTYTCTACKETKTEDIEATGHTWDEGVITKEATCTENGVKTYTCTACKETKTEEIAATGHTWDEGTVTKAATETEVGIKTYKCAACGETKTEEIPALGNVAENTGFENNYTPSTGDSTDVLLYMALAIIAMASCAGVCFRKGNKNRI